MNSFEPPCPSVRVAEKGRLGETKSPDITDLPTPPPLAPAQTGQRRSNLVRDESGRIIKNDRKINHGR